MLRCGGKEQISGAIDLANFLNNSALARCMGDSGENPDGGNENAVHGVAFDFDGADPGSGPQISASSAKISGSACFSSPATNG